MTATAAPVRDRVATLQTQTTPVNAVLRVLCDIDDQIATQRAAIRGSILDEYCARLWDSLGQLRSPSLRVDRLHWSTFDFHLHQMEAALGRAQEGDVRALENAISSARSATMHIGRDTLEQSSLQRRTGDGSA